MDTVLRASAANALAQCIEVWRRSTWSKYVTPFLLLALCATDGSKAVCKDHLRLLERMPLPIIQQEEPK
jgi:hypothetical protein